MREIQLLNMYDEWCDSNCGYASFLENLDAGSIRLIASTSRWVYYQFISTNKHIKRLYRVSNLEGVKI